MNNNLFRIKEIAEEVRDWAEALAEKRGDSRDLCGYCAIASGELHNRLTTEGIRADIIVAEFDDDCAHVFLAAEDHVVDVTATQFSEFRDVPVVVLHHREAEEHYFFRPSELMFTSAKALKKHQQKTKWPQRQTCFG